MSSAVVGVAPLRVLQTVPSIEHEASGPSQSVPSLCHALASAGHSVVLASVGGAWNAAKVPYDHQVASGDFVRVPVVSQLQASSGLQQILFDRAEWSDIIHSHGMWVMPNVYPFRAAKRAQKPLVVSPRGTLSPIALARSTSRKRLFWLLLQRKAMRHAACLHATSEQEYADIRRAGLRQPVAVISNGISIPPQEGGATAPQRTLLYLGRIHRIKGIENLLRAWHRISGQFSDWNLKIVGLDETGHRRDLERLAKELNLHRVAFEGPLYGSNKEAAYAAASLYILPSHSENFGVSVAEALARAVPVVTTTGTPWSDLPVRGCGWYTTADQQGLERGLREALSCDNSRLACMGQRGRAWMQQDFGWVGIAERFEQVYRWIIGGGSPPDVVRID